MTVIDYYKHFKSVFGVVVAAISGIPFLATLLPADYAQYFFPPLGSQETLFKIITLILVVLVTLIVYFTKDAASVSSKKGRLRLLMVCSILVLVGLVALLVVCLRFVRSINIASEHKDMIVSVGYKRTAFANNEFPNANDWEMLKARGPIEQEINTLWTFKSIAVARLSLLISYLFCILGAIAFLSFAILYDKLGIAPNP